MRQFVVDGMFESYRMEEGVLPHVEGRSFRLRKEQ